MFSLPCLFLVTTCFAVLARSLPGPLDSLNLSNNADEAISDEGLEIAATPDWCSTDDGSAAQKRSDLPSGACRNPSADQKPKIRPLIDDSPRRKNNPNTDPGPEPSGPAHSIRPPGGKLGGCPEGWKLLCGRGLRSDDPHTNGLLVKNLYLCKSIVRFQALDIWVITERRPTQLVNPGIPCQAIWCCRHYWSDVRPFPSIRNVNFG